MLHKAILQLARSTPHTLRFPFSQTPKPTDSPASSEPPKPASNEVKQQRQKRQDEQQQQPFQKQNRNTTGWWIYRIFFWGTFSALSYNLYLVHNHKQKTPVEDQTGAIPFIIDVAKSLHHQYNSFIYFITQPPSRKLLPDTVHPDLHPKTLVFNLTGTIIKTQYIFGKGQKVILRPGLEKLLRRLSQKYEIVIFAEEDQPIIMGSVMKLDPKMMYIRGLLGRESMVWKDGEFIKDLRYLNRDLRKIIAVDSHPNNLKIQPKNALIIPEFQGDQKDNQLQKLAYLLERLVDVPDVRKFIETLGDNPVQTYYQRVLKRQQQISKKTTGFFGGLAPKKDKKDKPKAQDDQM